MQVILPFFAPCGFGVRHGFLQHSASFCDKQEPHSAQLEARVATGLHKGAIHPGEAAKQFILALVGPNTARKIMLSRHLRRVLRSPHRSIAARRGTASRAAIALGRNRCSAHGAAATACVAAAAALLLHDDDDAAHCDAHAFAGQWCAVVTEFASSGAVTTKNVDRYAAHLKREGCVGVFVCGTSGESMSLSVDERERRGPGRRAGRGTGCA